MIPLILTKKKKYRTNKMAGIPFLKKETKQLHQYASNLKLNACYYSRK